MTRPGAFEQIDELANRRHAAAMDALYETLARKHGHAIAFDTTMAMEKYGIGYEDALSAAVDKDAMRDLQEQRLIPVRGY